jgi:magnesium transporter
MSDHEHRPETAGHHLRTGVPRAGEHETVADVIRAMRGSSLHAADSVYVVGRAGELVGVVPMHTLVVSAEETPLGQLMTADPPSVSPDTDQERVALLAIRHGLSSIPVVEGSSRVLMGVVPAPALLDILRREHVEDLHRLAGIGRETAKARDALDEPPARRVRHRLPWLLLGLAGSTLAAMVVARFRRVLETQLQLAFFLPGIVYLADAIGTQTEAVVVRGLSVSHHSFARLLRDELGTGFLIGLLLGAVALPLVWVSTNDLPVALTVSISLIGAGTVATTVGLVFPWALSRAGRDPAFGSGPIATIVQDVLSLLIYFTIASIAMGC